MTDINPTIAMREGEELDVTLIDGILKARIDGLEGTPTIKQFASGHSNLTYSINYANRSLVLRRPPFGTVPKGGHSMIREFRVMNGLKPAFPAVPHTYFHQPKDGSELGAEYYVMDLVEGRKLGGKIPSEWGFTAGDNRRLCLAFWDQLIALHGVDYNAIGLSDFGKPEGYVERQILGWNGRFEKAHTDDVEDFSDVRKWLAENMPTSEIAPAILHGDYRLDNVILDEDDPCKILAVLDWEISALGDPLMDLGNNLAYWMEPSDPEILQRLVMQPCTAPGMLSRAEITNYYGEKTGRDVSAITFYHVAGVFRNATILQQIYYRYYHGQTKNPTFAMFGKMVDGLGNFTRDLIAKG